jgi:hypothetical protein
MRRMRYPPSVTSAISKPRTHVPWKRLRTSTFVPGANGVRECALADSPRSVLTLLSYEAGARVGR